MIGPGTRLGPYEITALIGEGGMGKVWRAHHTALKRDDALKVLPDAFASDPERLARFRREAQVLASLNHPNIAHVYGLEQSDGVQALVMELVEGPTLADRIAQGPIPVDEALPIAKQIAEALEAAHERGIIHRDLKPANIKLRPDGVVKVLDFGLAKALEPASSANVNATASPTITSPAMMTGVGVLLGTAAYMSPEQAKGLPADHRSDVFSFGSVLYEMLVGQRPFHGDNVPEILASVLAREPDFTLLPLSLHPRLLELLRRCFEKTPRRRWQAVGDLRAEIESIAAATEHGRVSVSPAAPQAAWWRRAIAPAVTALAVATLGVAGITYIRPVPAAPTVMRFAVALQGFGLNFGNRGFAISPDGTRIAYATPEGLHVRSMSEFDTRLIVPTGATGIVAPFFSPDGQMLAFMSDGVLKRISVTGGTPVTIASLPANDELSWESDQILVGGTSAIRRVMPSGRTLEQLVPLKQGELGWAPHILPGGEWVLFTAAQGRAPEQWDEAQIVAQSISSGERRILVENGRDARYVSSGHLVFARGGVLFAAPLDVSRIELTMPPVPVLDGVRRSAINGTAHFSVSDSGTLIYLPGPIGLDARGARVEVVIANRDGAVERLPLPAGPYEHPRISPDGGRLVFGTTGQDQNIWTYDLAGSAAALRLTIGGRNRFPIWSADGRRIVFQSDRDGAPAVYWQAADGSGTPERLTQPDPGTAHIPDAWVPGQDRFLFSVVKGSKRTLWTFSVRDRTSERFDGIETADAVPRAAAVSPDGRWIVYVASDTETATSRGVFVQPVPPTGAAYQVSPRSVGHQPVWSADGKEIFFVPAGGQLAAVGVGSGPGFTFSTPNQLRRAIENLAPSYERNYDVTRDSRFVGFVAAGQGQSVLTGQVYVVLNWFEELKRLVPTN
jgi:serine/threonine-protein kinase